MTAAPDHPVLRLVRDREVRDPLLDIAIGPALLHHAARSPDPSLSNGVAPLLRLYRPTPTVAFSGRDCASPGIAGAAAAARSRGFIPVRRGAGGRAVAYHRGALCLDHVSRDRAEKSSIAQRFAVFAALYRDALRRVGIDAATVGEVPGEYCPGEYSVHDGHGHKLVGTAQRLVPGAWMFSAVVVVSDPDPLRDVLEAVYRELALDWDPATVGAIDRAAPGVGHQEVERALVTAYSSIGRPIQEPLPESVVELAFARADRHRVPEG
ncbi:MAG TPA: lipoate--protein ligase family protein [Nakamurella sp.]